MVCTYYARNHVRIDGSVVRVFRRFFCSCGAVCCRRSTRETGRKLESFFRVAPTWHVTFFLLRDLFSLSMCTHTCTYSERKKGRRRAQERNRVACVYTHTHTHTHTRARARARAYNILHILNFLQWNLTPKKIQSPLFEKKWQFLFFLEWIFTSKKSHSKKRHFTLFKWKFTPKRIVILFQEVKYF